MIKEVTPLDMPDLTWRAMNNKQRKIVKDAVLRLYFNQELNTSANIAKLLNIKPSVSHRIIDTTIVSEADLISLKLKYTD